MAVFSDSVVLTDKDGDVLSACPSHNEGTCHGVISVTHGADFQDGSIVSNAGTTQSVMVRSGDELQVLAALGDKLRGVQLDDSDDRTVVASFGTLKEIANKMGLIPEDAEALFALFTTASATDNQLV